MGITRTAIVDDSGPGTDGTIINNAWKQELYDQIDAVAASSVTAYTPVWSSSGTAPALGNGTLTGTYVKVGSLVTYDIKFVAGSTTTFGTGDYRFSLPFPTGGGSGVSKTHGWFAQDSSAGGAVYSGPASSGLFAANVVALNTIASTSAVTNVSPTIPITFAVGDLIYVSGSYFTP